jgi:hypothetical protein
MCLNVLVIKNNTLDRLFLQDIVSRLIENRLGEMERKFKLLSICKISFFLSSSFILLSITCVTSDSKMLKKHFFSNQRQEKLMLSKELLVEMNF